MTDHSLGKIEIALFVIIFSQGAFYVDTPEFKILTPRTGQQLIYYEIRLAREVENEGKGHPLEWRALKSFLGFIRTTYRRKNKMV